MASTKKKQKNEHVEPSTLSFIVVKAFRQVEAALRSADVGDLSYAADICDQLLGDEKVQIALDKLAGGILGARLSFEASGDGRKKNRAVRALEVEEDWWSMLPEAEASLLLRWGILFIGFAQLVWKESEQGRVLGHVKVWHPRHFRIRDGAWHVRLENGKELPIERAGGEWIIFTPYGGRRPWAVAPWRALGRWHLAKKFALEDWSRSSELAGGALVVNVDEDSKGDHKAFRKQLSEDLSNLGRDASIVLPPGYSLERLLAGQIAFRTSSELIEAADEAITIGISGENLSTEVNEGSHAATKSHLTVAAMRRRFFAEAFATCVHDEHLTWWAEFNFGSRALAPWPNWDTRPPEDPKSESETLKAWSEGASTAVAGGIMTVNEARAIRGLDPIDGGDEMREPQAPAPQTSDGLDDADKRAPSMRTKSGRKPGKGFLNGQLYADAVADKARDRGADAMRDDLDAVLEAIDGAESYESLRAGLPDLLRRMPVDPRAETIEKAVTLAEVGGRHAVNQDL